MGFTYTHAGQWFECVYDFCSLDGVEVMYLDIIHVESMIKQDGYVKYKAKIFRMGDSLTKTNNILEIDNDLIDDYLDIIEKPDY